MSIGPHTSAELRPQAIALRDAIPAVWQGYADMSRAALADGALSATVKELIALAIAVTRECDGCIAAHARGAARRGATAQEVAEALGVAIAMNGGPATVYGAAGVRRVRRVRRGQGTGQPVSRAGGRGSRFRRQATW